MGDGGKADRAADLAATSADLGSDSTRADAAAVVDAVVVGPEVGADLGGVQAPDVVGSGADGNRADGILGADLAGDGQTLGDARPVLDGPADAPEPDLRADLVDLRSPGDQPGASEAGAGIDTAGPVAAAPSGGCVPAIVTPSLAYHGVVGLDFDEDGIADDVDDCPTLPSPEQSDSDGDGLGDVCDRCPGGVDSDGDGICDAVDNCPVDWNPSQFDTDGDGVGNRCDSQRCFSSNGTEQIQQVLHHLLGKPDFVAALQGTHWRIMSADTYCRGTALGMSLVILDYRQRKQLAVTYLIATDELASFTVTDVTNLQGPQPSAEESRESMYLAEHDPTVGAFLGTMTGLISAGAFFYEFGTHAADNDPAFPTCATGRCVDVLYSGAPPDGAYGDYSVVVDMDACQVLGVRQRQ